jgi:phosphate transport system protein
MTTRLHFHKALQELHQDILKMGTMVEEALKKALTAFISLRIDLANQIIIEDEEINRMELTIEDKCTFLISTEQPVATDLREILTCLKIGSHLERIGDHAVHLAKSVIRIHPEPNIISKDLFKQMGDNAIDMLHEALSAFIKKNPEKAKNIAKRDDEIDALHFMIIKDLVASMHKKKDYIEQGNSLIFASRFLERVGDHATNICECVVFSSNGKHVELNR